MEECQMPCSRDINQFCGGPFRNQVYDLRDLNRGNQNSKSKEKESCDKELPHVNCDKKGGYDRNDPCNQTCMSTKEISDEETCSLKCFIQMESYLMRSSEEMNVMHDQCKLKCLG